ncbi:uncharacterized protein PHALS_05975 [Plasmopara halstedii]|uniref:Uncharacterized protein n=1 Tax=Plasmopara halstedii TaxID=4781 RepID=A0A0P1AB17_PLAHL|nr:uncharacterized protein PHALS_05975 [Plasmopara halstedii]CEG37929.1 hypothetical protein PHALS_05975 [Plasmopara halstedii]|eukprot:XP_024574298.1 hypothetical protein PHALS_05975 [Plasmopara halstedii]
MINNEKLLFDSAACDRHGLLEYPAPDAVGSGRQSRSRLPLQSEAMRSGYSEFPEMQPDESKMKRALQVKVPKGSVPDLLEIAIPVFFCSIHRGSRKNPLRQRMQLATIVESSEITKGSEAERTR